MPQRQILQRACDGALDLAAIERLGFAQPAARDQDADEPEIVADLDPQHAPPLRARRRCRRTRARRKAALRRDATAAAPRGALTVSPEQYFASGFYFQASY
ncbi:MAG: hypothetical protein ACXW3T_16525 [Rhodoplanes sp.]